MKKVLTCLLALCMLLSLAACTAAGSGAPASTPANTSEPADGAASAPADGTASAPAGEKPEKLVVWSMWLENELQSEVFREAAAEYEAATGIKIEYTYVGRHMAPQTLTALQAGEYIDMVDGGFFQEWLGNLTDLEPYYDKAYPTTGGAPLRDVLSPPLLQMTREMCEGKLQQVPYQPYAFMMFYDKTLFREAGIEETPKSWDEFLAVCQKLKDFGVNPISVDDTYYQIWLGSYLLRMIGIDAVTEMFETKNYDLPAVRQMAEAYQEMADLGYFSPSSGTNVSPAGEMEMATGTAGIYFNGSWMPNGLRDVIAEDFEWGAFAFPAVEGAVNGLEANLYGSQAFSVLSTSKYPEYCMDFIATLVTGKYDDLLAERTGGIPISNDAVYPADMADIKPIVEATTVRYESDFTFGYYPEASAMFSAAFSRLLSGDIDADGFMAAVTAG